MKLGKWINIMLALSMALSVVAFSAGPGLAAASTPAKPAPVITDFSMDNFASISEGKQIICLTGFRENLTAWEKSKLAMRFSIPDLFKMFMWKDAKVTYRGGDRAGKVVEVCTSDYLSMFLGTKGFLAK